MSEYESLHGRIPNVADAHALNVQNIERLVDERRAEAGSRSALRLRRRLERIVEEQRRAAIRSRLES